MFLFVAERGSAMPVHDWTRVDAGVFHDFHQRWIGAIRVTVEQPLGMAAYLSELVPTAYFQPVAVGDSLVAMPAFLTADLYVNVPLESTYMDAWRGVPTRWKRVIEAAAE
jgi:hypothetical protein